MNDPRPLCCEPLLPVELWCRLAALRTLLEAGEERAWDRAAEGVASVRWLVDGLVQRRLQGAGLLAVELHHGFETLAAGSVESPGALAAQLLHALSEFSEYLSDIQRGEPDCALLLQPRIDALRRARGEATLGERGVFVAQMIALQRKPATTPDASDELRALARRSLPAFEAALLQWLRGRGMRSALGRIAQLAQEIAQELAASAGAHQALWEAVAACAEAQLEGAFADTAELKRQLGRAARQLRALAEAEPGAEAATELLYALCFLAGDSSGLNPRIESLRQRHHLAALLPPVHERKALRRRLRGPDEALRAKLQAQLTAMQEAVDDELDMAQRRGETQPSPPAQEIQHQLASLRELLAGIDRANP